MKNFEAKRGVLSKVSGGKEKKKKKKPSAKDPSSRSGRRAGRT